MAEEDVIIDEQFKSRQAKSDLERAVVARVYNYFRIVLSFLLLILFFEVEDQTFVGTLEPRWFQIIMSLYLLFNVVTGLVALVDSKGRLYAQSAVGSIVALDIFFISALLLTSGGIESGLGYLLVFAVAFGSVMLGGQLSLAFAAVATVNSITVELYMDATGAVEGSQHFFEVAMLGVSFFIVTFFFQFVSRIVADRDEEVVSLEALGRMHRLAEASRYELEVANARFTALLRSTAEGVLVLDTGGAITFANDQAAELLELGVDSLIGTDIRRFMVRPAGWDDTGRHPRVLELLEAEDLNFDPNRWQTANDKVFLVDSKCEESVDKDGNETGVVVVFRNVTEQRENEERVQYLASYDDLTGLANRTNFKEVLTSAISRTRRTDRELAILLVDSDHFTVINEQKGQAAGDEMLIEMASRLSGLVREGDLVARLHGDQFALMLVDMDQAEDAAIVAEKINRSMVDPIEVATGPINTSVSIGIAVLSDDHKDADELMSAATSAMENAKTQGRNTFRFFHADMQSKADERRRVQMMLRQAIDNDEFTMMFQPIVSIRESRIYSSEALIRWFPPGADPIRPDIFIPVAEESGQINAIGSWVLKTVSNQVLNWREVLGHYPSVAINVSTKQLRDQEFREQFQRIVKVDQLPVNVVEMELTETGVMEDPETALSELTLLRELGVRISIDDFGTGYSSLDYLRRLPLDILKIDQSFTRGIGESENDEEIVRVMIRMAHAMGLGVICEGVETREQLDFLRDHDCDYAQGYYFSKPRTIDDITELFIAERDGLINIMDGT